MVRDGSKESSKRKTSRESSFVPLYLQLSMHKHFFRILYIFYVSQQFQPSTNVSQSQRQQNLQMKEAFIPTFRKGSLFLFTLKKSSNFVVVFTFFLPL